MLNRPLSLTPSVSRKEEKPQYKIKDLSRLIKDNNLEGVKEVIANVQKSAIQKYGKYSKQYLAYEEDKEAIPNAMRDAILLEHNEIVSFLLESGVDPNCRIITNNDVVEYQPIYFAVIKNNLPLVELLIKHGAHITPDPRVFDTVTDIAIDTATQLGFYDIAKCLLEHGASSMGSITFRDKIGGEEYAISHLAYAANMNRLDLVELLLKHGADISDALTLNFENFTEQYNKIEYFIKYCPEECNELLKEKNARVEAYRSSIFILMDYVSGMDFRSLDFLKRIDISGMNFLGISVNQRPITHEVLNKLGLIGAEKAITTINELNRVNETRRSVLQARLDRSFKKLGGLIDKKSGVVIFTPLWMAVTNGDIETVKARLEFKEENPTIGADLMNFFSWEAIPIFIAIKNNRKDIIECLLKHPSI